MAKNNKTGYSYYFSNPVCMPESTDYIMDKTQSNTSIINYMLIRLSKMFNYTGLPDTIPQEFLEHYLMLGGSCIIGENTSKNTNEKGLYCMTGSLSEEPDEYYRPTHYIVTNPYLKESKTYTINKDCILMKNDYLLQGLYPLLSRYSSLMVENYITFKNVNTALRSLDFMTAPDDASRIACDEFYKKRENGENYAIGDTRIMNDGVTVNTSSNRSAYMTQFIEYQQYLQSSMYNELGIQSNYNMKRESINSSEASLSDDLLVPLVEQMLESRKQCIDLVNNLFNTNISVEFSSIWKENEITRNAELDNITNPPEETPAKETKTSETKGDKEE